MRTDFGIKRFAENDCIIKLAAAFVFGLFARVEPEFHSIKELKAREVNERGTVDMVSGTKEDSRREDSLEALDNTAVMRSVLRQVEELKNLSGAGKMYLAAFLPDGESGNPDGNKAVLAEGQAEVRMRCDIEKELAVMPRVRKPISRWAAQGNATEHERPGVKGEITMAVFSLLPDEADSLDAFQGPLTNRDLRFRKW